MIRRYLARRRHSRAVAAVHADRVARMPWLWFAATTHHAGHAVDGTRQDDCGVCNPQRLVELLEELEPMPTETGATS